MDVPALSMTDSSGTRLWETAFPLDKGQRIEAAGAFMAGASILDCAGILMMANAHIVAAQRILIMPDLKSDEAASQELKLGIHLRPGTLLIAFDLEGKEVARVRHDDVIGARLVATPGGCFLKRPIKSQASQILLAPLISRYTYTLMTPTCGI